jgi:hypothetical protein
VKDEHVGSPEESALEVLGRMFVSKIFFFWMASLLNSVAE